MCYACVVYGIVRALSCPARHGYRQCGGAGNLINVNVVMGLVLGRHKSFTKL